MNNTADGAVTGRGSIGFQSLCGRSISSSSWADDFFREASSSVLVP
jgi:hypothetical protein